MAEHHDLNILPKFRDGWSYLYVEHARIDQDAKAIAIHDATGRYPVPCAMLALLMLGPGTRITHAAILTLASHGCLVAWVGEQGVRFYAAGLGETRRSRNLLRQAGAWADVDLRMAVVRRMYEHRFDEKPPPTVTLQQLRGMEGARVRRTYSEVSDRTGVAWYGRRYNREDWGKADPVNRALSAANSCLYGVCHAAIVSMGFSPGIGFIHTGKLTSFVYDIGDLYKTDTTIPLAFDVAREGDVDLERRVRLGCRDVFHRTKLLERVASDLNDLFEQIGEEADSDQFDTELAAPGDLWDDEEGSVPGGSDYGG